MLMESESKFFCGREDDTFWRTRNLNFQHWKLSKAFAELWIFFGPFETVWSFMFSGSQIDNNNQEIWKSSEKLTTEELHQFD